MTKFDAIKEMTIEQLARWINEISPGCGKCYFFDFNLDGFMRGCKKDCVEGHIRELESEVE